MPSTSGGPVNEEEASRVDPLPTAAEDDGDEIVWDDNWANSPA